MLYFDDPCMLPSHWWIKQPTCKMEWF